MPINKNESKQVNAGEIFFISIQHDDHFIPSGQKDSIVIHIKVVILCKLAC